MDMGSGSYYTPKAHGGHQGRFSRWVVLPLSRAVAEPSLVSSIRTTTWKIQAPEPALSPNERIRQLDPRYAFRSVETGADIKQGYRILTSSTSMTSHSSTPPLRSTPLGYRASLNSWDVRTWPRRGIGFTCMSKGEFWSVRSLADERFAIKELPRDEAGLREWCEETWQRKDRLLAEMMPDSAMTKIG